MVERSAKSEPVRQARSLLTQKHYRLNRPNLDARPFRDELEERKAKHEACQTQPLLRLRNLHILRRVSADLCALRWRSHPNLLVIAAAAAVAITAAVADVVEIAVPVSAAAAIAVTVAVAAAIAVTITNAVAVAVAVTVAVRDRCSGVHGLLLAGVSCLPLAKLCCSCCDPPWNLSLRPQGPVGKTRLQWNRLRGCWFISMTA